MQVIQELHNNNNAPKGFLKTMIKVALESKSKRSKCETDTLDLINYKSLNTAQRQALGDRLLKVTLLSDGGSNPKTAKAATGVEFQNYIMHLSPSDLSGVNVCPSASKGCRAACLNGAGRGLFDGVQIPRLRKTLYYVHYKAQFLDHLNQEVSKRLAKATKQGIKAAFRLNGTSDIPWESIKIPSTGKSIMASHPTAIFYDYTKIVSRIDSQALTPNYRLTVSASENNDSQVNVALMQGTNAAVVFHEVPTYYNGFVVIDGDSHDFRFLDPNESIGYVIGLKAKGPAKKDKSGFVKQAA